MRIAGLAVIVACTTLAACQDSPPGKAEAHGGSLPSVSSGHRPGPDILYAAPAVAPQLENSGIWKAEPILVSGAVTYRDGEFLYQDFLYDDHGAAGVPDRNNPYDLGGFLFAPAAGTFTYPADVAKYGHNAADLVEFRVKPLADYTAFRITLNTMLDSDATAVTIALADLGPDGAVADIAAAEWPHGAGVSSPATHFITVHRQVRELALADGTVSPAYVPMFLDPHRRQIEVRVPHSAWDPTGHRVGVTVGVGLWDTEARAYLAPAEGEATATVPGGGSPLGVAIVNVGPRLAEPQPALNDPTATWTLADSAVGAAVQAHWWRERAQADALRLGDVAAFQAEVDFAKLAAGVTDDSGVPAKGSINRILASHYAFGQGHDPTRICFDIGSSIDVGAACEGRFVGQLQPYALYIPDKPEPGRGWGLTLLLHSLSANYNQYASSRNQSQLGERGAGSLVITPAGRGPDGFYAGIAEADTFEVWADVARHYRLDPEWVAISGYSMGGFGTYRLLSRWPDLFGRGFSVVAIPGDADPMLPALRNVALMTWCAVADELVRIDQTEDTLQRMTDLGLRVTHWLFPTADHLTLATNDEYAPGAEFLGEARVDRDPPHVTYVVNTATDNAVATAVADHAYWLSAIRARDAATPGTIDVRSEGFGVGDAAPLEVAQDGGALLGGNHGPMPYVSRTLEWGEAPAAPAANVLHVVATNVAAVTIDPRRARVGCDAQLNVESDGAIEIKLDGC